MTSRPRAGSCDEPPTKLKLRVGGPGSKGSGHTRRRDRREKQPAGAVRGPGGVEERVRRAVHRDDAQRRRLPVLGHNVREGAARAEASDGAVLPAIVKPPVEPSPAHQRSAQVAGRRRRAAASTLKPIRVGGIGGGATAVPVGRGGAGRGRERLVACSKAAMASSQLVRLSSGSHVSPAASRPVQRTSTYGRP